MSEPAFMWTPPNVIHPFFAIADPPTFTYESAPLENK
jgi:hypothetical protein